MKLKMLVVTAIIASGAPMFALATQAASTTMANDLPSPDKEFVQAASVVLLN
jgi:putative membrane protein